MQLFHIHFLIFAKSNHVPNGMGTLRPKPPGDTPLPQKVIENKASNEQKQFISMTNKSEILL